MTVDTRPDRRPLVLVVVGPTAVGKSDLAMALASRQGGEIISADSRQIYRYLDIGTAKPTIAERLIVPHHLVDIVAPDEEYSLASFQRDAYRAIAGAIARGRLPIVVGGTGLYIRAVVDGLRIPQVAPHPELRLRLEEEAASDGGASLHRRLAECDDQAAARIDRRNVRRVIRALEVCLVTGRPISELQQTQPPAYDFLLIGLTCPRATLYQRIDERVERQVANGLIEETRLAAELGYDYHLPAMSGLGHKQMGLYLSGKISLAEAVKMDQHDTHRFARQQHTWFRSSDPRIHWFARNELGWEEIVRQVENVVAERHLRSEDKVDRPG